MKQIHHYDEQTGLYLGTSDAFESPIEPGVFLIPAFATDIDLPEYEPDKVMIFQGGAWVWVDE